MFFQGSHYVALAVPNLLIVCEGQDEDEDAKATPVPGPSVSPHCSESRAGMRMRPDVGSPAQKPHSVTCSPGPTLLFFRYRRAHRRPARSCFGGCNKSHSPVTCRRGSETTGQETQGSVHTGQTCCVRGLQVHSFSVAGFPRWSWDATGKGWQGGCSWRTTCLL